MLRGLMRGAAAGAAGTTALNAVTYLDMTIRARPSSSTPEQVVDELTKRAGHPVPGSEEERENRLQGLGPLAGSLTGVGVGAVAGWLRQHGVRLGPVLAPALIGAAAMAITDGMMGILGISDPRSWDASSWISDGVPHLAYGGVTYALLTATIE